MSTVDGDTPVASTRQLPPDLQLHILSLLPPNEIACTARLTSKGAAQRFSTPHHLTAFFSLPLPPHVTAPCWIHAVQPAAHSLSHKQRLLLPSTAARSGSTTNLALAWELLQPCLLSQLLQSGHYTRHLSVCGIDPGVAAATAGHVHLLPWLLIHNLTLPSTRILAAAAQHCNLASLRTAYQLICEHSARSISSGSTGAGNPQRTRVDLLLRDSVLDAAAASLTQDANEKVAWLLEQQQQQQQQHDSRAGVSSETTALCCSPKLSLRPATAVAAAAAGNLHLMQWLRQQGCKMGRYEVLASALRHGDLAAVRWLVEEAGCSLPAAHQHGLPVAAAASGSVPLLKWLLARGVVPVTESAMVAAAAAGALDAVRFLHHECGQELTRAVFSAACGSGCIPTAAFLHQAGCPMGHNAYLSTAQRGDAAMVTWLAAEAHCPRGPNTVTTLVVWWPWKRTCGGGGGVARPAVAGGAGTLQEGLLASVRLMVEAGAPTGGTVTLNQAAGRGDLGLVRYLHEAAGCALDSSTMCWAAKGGCPALTEWLVTQGRGLPPQPSSGPSLVGDPYVAAGRNNDLATLECLRRLGVGMRRGALPAAVWEACDVEVLRWLVGQGAAADGEVLGEALEAAVGQRGPRGSVVVGGGLEVVVWLKELQVTRGSLTGKGELTA